MFRMLKKIYEPLNNKGTLTFQDGNYLELEYEGDAYTSYQHIDMNNILHFWPDNP